MGGEARVVAEDWGGGGGEEGMGMGKGGGGGEGEGEGKGRGEEDGGEEDHLGSWPPPWYFFLFQANATPDVLGEARGYEVRDSNRGKDSMAVGTRV